MKSQESHWKSLLKGAAKVGGQLTGAERDIGLTSDHAKVTNDHPQEEFAVNLDVDIGRLLWMTTAEEVIGYVSGKDDDGQPVKTMPISATSSSIWLDFSEAMFDLPYQGEDVPLPDFVSNLSHKLKQGLDSGKLIVNFPEFCELENFKLVRIIWMKSLSAWYPQFEEK